jgi:hypothetical protein
MGSVTYKRLFNTRVVHDFYVDYFSRNDLAIVPTIETEQAMKNSGMQFRKDDIGFRVLYRVDDSNNAFISFSNVGLVFALTLKNISGFLNFTDLDDNTNPYAGGKIIYFTNRTNVTANDLDYDLLDYLRSKIFSYQFPQTGTGPNDMGHIKITNQANVDVTSLLPSSPILTPDTQNRYFYAADFTKLPSGLYTFETWMDSNITPVDKKVYIDNNLARQGVFGIVDILATNDNPANYPPVPGGPVVPPITDAAVYNMNFTRRISRWKYIVVYKTGNINTGNDGNLAITDTTLQPPYNPNPPGNPIVFAKTGYTTVNGYDASVWLSNLPALPFFETSKTGIDLKNGASTIIADVSGPRTDLQSGTATESEIFLYI